MPALLAHPLARARVAIALLAIAPIVMVGGQSLDGKVLIGGMGHAAIAGGMGLLALVTALLVSRAAWQRHDLRAALVASGFTALSGLLIIHALATPGGPIFDGMTSTVGLAGVMSMPVGASFIAIAMSISTRTSSTRRRVVQVQVATLAAATTFGAIGLTTPTTLPAVPLMEPPYSTLVLLASIPTLVFGALRVHRVADITRRPSDAAMFVGIVALAMAITSYVLSTPFDAQFWLGHALEAVALTCISVGVVGDVRRPVSRWRLTLERDGRTTTESSEQLLGGYVHALTVTLATVDPSTWNHSRRVAELAVEVGRELGLDADVIRRLAAAGLVHDIGKLRIPHDILHKPGKLTDEEFELVRAHPDFGIELLSRLRGFDQELPIVLGHHEKLNGKGYPAGLAGDEIGLETRIMTACDVYDALTDARSYKQPWPAERALALLHEERGTAFDAVVVEALQRVVARRAAEAADERAEPDAELLPGMPITAWAAPPAMRPIDTPSGLLPASARPVGPFDDEHELPTAA